MQPRRAQPETFERSVAAGKNSTAERAAKRPAQKPAEFVLHMPHAHSASVAGSFNDWDFKRTPMTRDPVGRWKATASLPPGRYEYRFVVDGQWISDPSAKEFVGNSFGSTNSILVI
jgi:1,4-alpha-glucan branching enzyme